jgi:hypothetical protein
MPRLPLFHGHEHQVDVARPRAQRIGHARTLEAGRDPED